MDTSVAIQAPENDPSERLAPEGEALLEALSLILAPEGEALLDQPISTGVLDVTNALLLPVHAMAADVNVPTCTLTGTDATQPSQVIICKANPHKISSFSGYYIDCSRLSTSFNKHGYFR
jgi:hypothetical protein